MNDMSQVIVPKSDQINADDLLAGPRIITIRDVNIRPGTEQPVSIFFENDNGKAWRPCKSMSRVLVAAWGADAKEYIGRSVKLFCDPNVTWGGMKVGGIRISHMSHIEREMVIALTATKGKKVMATIKPLTNAPSFQQQKEDPAAKWAAAYTGKLATLNSLDEVEAFAAEKAAKLGELGAKRPELHQACSDALYARRHELAVEGPADEQRGEDFIDATGDEDEF